MTWLYFTFISVAFFTALNLIQRVIAVDSKYPRAMALLFNGIASFFALIIFIFSRSADDFRLPTGIIPWLVFLVASLAYAGFERWRFYVAKLVEASVLITILNISVIVAFVGSMIIYKEPLTPSKLIGSLLILIALFLVSYQKTKKALSQKGLIVAVSISLIMGVGWMLDKLGAQYFGVNTYNFLIWSVPIIFIYLPYLKLSEIKYEYKRASWKIAVLSAINVFAYFFHLKALERAEATRVIPIEQTSIMFTVILGIIILKERENVLKKIIAGALALIGVYFLV